MENTYPFQIEDFFDQREIKQLRNEILYGKTKKIKLTAGSKLNGPDDYWQRYERWQNIFQIFVNPKPEQRPQIECLAVSSVPSLRPDFGVSNLKREWQDWNREPIVLSQNYIADWGIAYFKFKGERTDYAVALHISESDFDGKCGVRDEIKGVHDFQFSDDSDYFVVYVPFGHVIFVTFDVPYPVLYRNEVR